MSGAPVSAGDWFGAVPVRRVELVRMIVFGYAAAWLLVRAAYVRDVAALPARRWEPVGVLAGLGAPPDGVVVLAVWLVALVACAAVVARRAIRLAAPVGALGMLALATYTSSFGQVFHTEHLLVLHLAVLATACVVEPVADRDATTSGWPLNLMAAIVAVTYVLAGVAKLRWSGVGWVTGDVLQNWIAIDNLRKHLFGDWYSPLGGWLSSIGWVWPPIAVLTLLVEFGAPLAVLGGRLRTVWLVAAWAFHVGVFVLMAISFPFQLFGVAYVAFLRVEVAEASLRARWRRRRTATGRSDRTADAGP